MYFIGIDRGTSSLKLLLADRQGTVLRTVTKEYPLLFPQPGWSEQEPSHWWQAVQEGVAFAIRDSFEMARSLGIAIPRSMICGGGSKSPLWRQMIADILDIPLDIPATEQGSGYDGAMLAREFDGSWMFVAAAEGDGDLINGRGDAYCGMLNCSYNLGMRHIPTYIPEYPVGTAEDIASMMKDFVPVGRAILGLRDLKIITFGPRPQDFFACNAPIKCLYGAGRYINSQETPPLFWTAST